MRALEWRLRKLAQLTHQAMHDPLSRLPNRKLFLHYLDEALVRHGGNGVAVLFLDLDRFKSSTTPWATRPAIT